MPVPARVPVLVLGCGLDGEHIGPDLVGVLVLVLVIRWATCSLHVTVAHLKGLVAPDRQLLSASRTVSIRRPAVAYGDPPDPRAALLATVPLLHPRRPVVRLRGLGR